MMAHLIFNYIYVFHLFTLATCPAQIDAYCSLNKLPWFQTALQLGTYKSSGFICWHRLL